MVQACFQLFSYITQYSTASYVFAPVCSTKGAARQKLGISLVGVSEAIYSLFAPPYPRHLGRAPLQYLTEPSLCKVAATKIELHFLTYLYIFENCQILQQAIYMQGSSPWAYFQCYAHTTASCGDLYCVNASHTSRICIRTL